MKIKKIVLFNVGPYSGVNEFNIDCLNKSKNIVLVGGKNGAGKTTFFTSLRTCLYGYRAYGYENTNQHYFDEIYKLINDNEKSKDLGCARVELELLFDDGMDNNEYQIIREWKITNRKISEEYHIYQNSTELQGDELLDFENYLLHIIPPNLFKFYFFDGEKIAEYLPGIPDTTYFVFVETQVDKRSKLYKAVGKQGRVSEFASQDEQTLKRWILGMLKKEGKNITASDLQFLLERTGTQMANIKTEMEKLLCYTLEKTEITREDIEEICTKRVQNQIFDMINAIADREQKKALQLYYDLLTLKEPPMRILALIGRQFNLLLQVKELKKKGYSQQVIAEKTGLHGFVVGKYEKQAARFKSAELREALEACVEADENVKTGKMNDVMSVEILICKYSANDKMKKIYITKNFQSIFSTSGMN